MASIFAPDLQPFMLSWMKYDPQQEIQKLGVPVLITNGTADLQIDVSEAELLQTVAPDAQYEIIENMNHVLKEITGGDMENQKSYNDPMRPVVPKLIEVISGFIKK